MFLVNKFVYQAIWVNNFKSFGKQICLPNDFGKQICLPDDFGKQICLPDDLGKQSGGIVNVHFADLGPRVPQPHVAPAWLSGSQAETRRDGMQFQGWFRKLHTWLCPVPTRRPSGLSAL